jgi:hypothetical protein
MGQQCQGHAIRAARYGHGDRIAARDRALGIDQRGEFSGANRPLRAVG